MKVNPEQLHQHVHSPGVGIAQDKQSAALQLGSGSQPVLC